MFVSSVTWSILLLLWPIKGLWILLLATVMTNIVIPSTFALTLNSLPPSPPTSMVMERVQKRSLPNSDSWTTPTPSWIMEADASHHHGGHGPNVPIPFYRYFDPSTGDHFYTTDVTEITNGKQSYIFQKMVGKIYRATRSGTVPLLRYYNTNTLHHHYTINLGQYGGGDERHEFQGICGYVFEKAEDDTLPLYRFHNGVNGDQFYTTNLTELIILPGYKLQAIEAYIYPVNYVEFLADLEKIVAKEIFDTQWSVIETFLRSEVFSKVAEAMDDLSVNVTQLQEVIRRVEYNPVPIGFIYVQIPHQSSPHELWPSPLIWTDISSTYAGQFFRVVGGEAAPFGTLQKDNAPRITKAETKASIHSYPGTVDFPVGGTSEFLYSAQFGTINKFEGTRYTTSGGEVRPINQAVKVWKRTG